MLTLDLAQGYGGLYHIDGDKMNLIHQFKETKKMLGLIYYLEAKGNFRPSNSKVQFIQLIKFLL